MNATFVGWVPTITGNLSFSTIGIGRTPQKSFKLFRSFSTCRYTIIAQKRNKSDSIFRNLVDPFREKRGDHYFLFIGRCFNEGGWKRIAGPVFILSPDVYEIASLYLLSIRDDDDEPTVSSWIDRLVARLTDFIGSHHCFVAAASLERNGRLEVTVNSTVFDTDDTEVISAQAYYFVRDVCHVHQHHSRTSDTILEIYPVTPHDPLLWKRETLYALYRWIIQRKRERSSFSYIRSKGVLAYAEAFRTLHVSTNESDEFPKYLVNEVRLSLDAGIESAKLVSETWSGRKAAFGAFVFAFLAFFVSLSALFRDVIDSPMGTQIADSREATSFREFLIMVASHPWQTSGLVMLALVVFSIPFSFRSYLRDKPFFLDILRLLYGASYEVSVLVVLFVLGLSLWVGFQISGALAL